MGFGGTIPASTEIIYRFEEDEGQGIWLHTPEQGQVPPPAQLPQFTFTSALDQMGSMMDELAMQEAENVQAVFTFALSHLDPDTSFGPVTVLPSVFQPSHPYPTGSTMRQIRRAAPQYPTRLGPTPIRDVRSPPTTILQSQRQR